MQFGVRLFSRVSGLALSLELCFACGCAPPSAKCPEQQDIAACAQSWALGEGTRAGSITSPETYMLLLAKGQSPPSQRSASTVCDRTSSILPAPAGDARIFLAVGGRLHVRDTSTATTRTVEGTDAALYLRELLAFEAAASPLRILVTARVKGEEKDSLWNVTIDGKSAIGQSRVKDGSIVRDSATFFATFATPRCEKKDTNCLVAQSVDGQWFVDLEPTRHAARKPYLSLGSSPVVDAAWDPGKKSLYVLLQCSPAGEGSRQ